MEQNNQVSKRSGSRTLRVLVNLIDAEIFAMPNPTIPMISGALRTATYREGTAQYRYIPRQQKVQGVSSIEKQIIDIICLYLA